MPKKTKKHKLLSDARRRLVSAPTQPLTFHIQSLPDSKQIPPSDDDRKELVIIKKDLTKTLVLAIIAIAVVLGMNRMFF